MGSCYPALIGQNTPRGEFKLIKRYTQQAGYGGDVLQFSEDATTAYAIHRPWLLKPEQQRLKTIQTNFHGELRSNYEIDFVRKIRN